MVCFVYLIDLVDLADLADLTGEIVRFDLIVIVCIVVCLVVAFH